MTRIMLTPQSLDTESCRFTQAADSLSCINSRILSMVSSLDLEIRSKGSLENKIQIVADIGCKLATEADRLGQYLKTASRTFQDADANANTDILAKTCVMPGLAGGAFAGIFIGGKGIINTGLGWYKSIISDSFAIDYKDYNGIWNKLNNFKVTYPPSENGKLSIFPGPPKACKRFARDFYESVFGINLPNQGDPAYTLGAPLNQVHEVNQLVYQDKTITAEEIRNLFKMPPAKIGDMIQMVGTTGLHSAIFEGIDGDGNIIIYDANFDNINGIHEQPRTPEWFARYLNCSGGGATIYSPNLNQIPTSQVFE